jgi:hypothetical protein
MSTQNEEKDAKGRSWDQITKDGTSSAGSMGSGGTGDIGRMSGSQGSEQSSSRTDDLLAGDTADQEAEQGFGGGSQSGQVQTGMEGIGRGAAKGGNQQSSQPGAQGGERSEDAPKR